MIDPGSRFRQRETVLRQDVAGSTVLFNMEDGLYYSLNDVGARAWVLCDGTRTVLEIVTMLFDEYDAPEETIRADVFTLFGELSGERLLVPADPPA